MRDIENSGIYEIYCEELNAKYIGSSRDLKQRLINHKSLLSNGTHTNTALQRASLNYKLKPRVVERGVKPNKLFEREQFYFDKALDEGYSLFNLVSPQPSHKVYYLVREPRIDENSIISELKKNYGILQDDYNSLEKNYAKEMNVLRTDVKRVNNLNNYTESQNKELMQEYSYFKRKSNETIKSLKAKIVELQNALVYQQQFIEEKQNIIDVLNAHIKAIKLRDSQKTSEKSNIFLDLINSKDVGEVLDDI